MYLPKYGESPYFGIFLFNNDILKINNDIMTLYSKWFNTHNEYEAYKNGLNYFLPNVSICYRDLDVHYDPYKDPRFIARFNITDISSPSIIAGKAPWVSTPWFTDIEIDGEIISNEDIIIDNVYIKYLFNNTGRHTIKFSFDNLVMTTIDSFTFYSNSPDNISEMESLIIPFGITSISGLALNNLTSVTIPNSVTTLGTSAFSGTGLTSVTIPNSVTTIGTRAFNNCTGLTSLTIPNSVTTIGDNAFNFCTGLTSVTIPNSVTTLDGFSGCIGLTSITIPNSVTTLSAFSSCTGLTSITIPNSVTILSGFGNCTGLTSITIPNSVTTIGNNAFYGCTGLTSITIPDSVTTLGGFINCTGLTSITIPNSVTTLSGFRGCTGLTSVTISNSVTTIGTSSFSDCTGLTSITIPNSVTTINDGVLSNCTNLTAIIILCETPPSIQSSAFGGTTFNCPIYVPANSVDLYKSTLTSFANRIQAIP